MRLVVLGFGVGWGGRLNDTDGEEAKEQRGNGRTAGDREPVETQGWEKGDTYLSLCPVSGVPKLTNYGVV